MDLAAIASAVLDETGRPEKATMVARAVKAVVLKAHETDYFPQDLVVGSATTPAGGVSTLTSAALPSRFRKFSSIEVVSSAGASFSPRVFLPFKTPDNILQFDGTELNSYAYLAGSVVILKHSSDIAKYRMTYWAAPDVSATDKTTWITSNSSYEQDLIDGACAYVYRKLGDTDTVRGYLQMWQEFQARLRAENMIEFL